MTDVILMDDKKNIVAITAGVALLIAGIFLLSASPQTRLTMDEEILGDVQRFELTMRDGQYYPQTIVVKVNQTVEIVGGPEIQGCGRVFTIPAFGITQNIAATDNVVRFTPTKTGSFPFSCTQGLTSGIIHVI